MSPIPEQFDVEVGATFAERYHITGKVGEGGMGSIFEARDHVLDRAVAIKTISRSNLAEAELMRFQREAKAASNIKHPNVIQMFDFGIRETGQPFMVMELLKGQSIVDLIRDKGRQSADFTLRTIEQIAEGMSAVHKAGILHRDLKSSNIMLVDIGAEHLLVRILDFGIARTLNNETEANAITKAGQIFGSPHYMSPEQAKGDEIDQRSDIYSLGCIAVEMLTGRTLFGGDTIVEVVSKHINEPPPSISELSQSDTPKALEEMVAQMVAKDRNDRLPTMEEVARLARQTRLALANVQEEQPIEPAAPSHLLSPELKVLAVWVGSLIVAIALIGAGGYSWWTSQQVEKHKRTSSEQKHQKRRVEHSEIQFDIVSKVGELLEGDGFYVKHDGPVTKDLETILASKKPVVELAFFDCTLTADDFQMVAKASPRNLNLSGSSGVTDDALRTLCQIKTLRYLSLDLQDKLAPKSLAILAKSQTLCGLSMRRCNLTPQHYEVMGKLKNIKWFQLNGNPVSLTDLQLMGTRESRLVVIIDEGSIYQSTPAEIAELRVKQNIVIGNPQDVPEDMAASYMSKFGLDSFSEISNGSDAANTEAGRQVFDHDLDIQNAVQRHVDGGLESP